jgi:hypothetical protein
MTPSSGKEQTVIVHSLSDAAPFATCLRLFRRYPLAVTPRSADAADGGHRSMVLMNHADGPAGYFVLTQVRDDLFVIRSWNRHGISREIRPGEPVSGVIRQVITDGMPIPHDGALLGWVADSQVTVMLAVHCRQQETPGGPVSVPGIRVMPMVGTSELLHWPPFTASPLGDGRLWEYVEWDQIVDIGPLVAQRPGRAFWVPTPDGWSVRPGEGCVVVTDNLPTDEYWLPAGVYVDHWTLREGIETPPANCLLELPGAVDLAYSLARARPGG